MWAQSLAEITRDSLVGVWGSVVTFIPQIIGALLVLIIGLIVAWVFRWLTEQIVNGLKIDNILRRVGFEVYVERAGLRLNSAKFFGLFVYWFFIVVFVTAAAGILRIFELSIFLSQLIAYVPSVIAAILIMLATLVLANFLRSLVRSSVLSAKLHASKFLGSLTWWAVVITGLLTALEQLKVPFTVINTVITGLIAMLALAGGIAFGLGGKEYAAHLLERLREHTEND